MIHYSNTITHISSLFILIQIIQIDTVKSKYVYSGNVKPLRNAPFDDF